MNPDVLLNFLIFLTVIVLLLALATVLLAISYLRKARRIFDDYQRNLAREFRNNRQRL